MNTSMVSFLNFSLLLSLVSSLSHFSLSPFFFPLIPTQYFSLSPHCPDLIPKTLKKTRFFLPELSIQCSNLDWNCSLRSHLPPKLFASFTEFPFLKPGRKQGPALPASSELTLWLRSALCFSLLASGPLSSFSRHLHLPSHFYQESQSQGNCPSIIPPTNCQLPFHK